MQKFKDLFEAKKKIKYVGIPEYFWVVTEPTKDAVLNDIVFETTLFGFMNQIRGGLTEKEVLMITDNEKEAIPYGNKILSIRDKDKKR